MIVAASLPFTVSLIAPPGDIESLGARIEVPITHAIAVARVAAVLAGSLWTLTINAPLFVGDYLLHWLTPEDPPTYSEFVPVTVVAGEVVTGVVPAVDYPALDRSAVTPSVGDVALLERTRTVEAGGSENTTFTSNTRPTATEVTALIQQALDQVLSELPRGSQDAFNPTHYPQVKRAATLATAILLEVSFFREQADDRAVQIWQTMLSAVIGGVSADIRVDLAQQDLLGTMEPRDLAVPLF